MKLLPLNVRIVKSYIDQRLLSIESLRNDVQVMNLAHCSHTVNQAIENVNTGVVSASKRIIGQARQPTALVDATPWACSW
jgi:hypothetical protein